MLRPILILALTAIAVATATGCKKSDSAQPPGNRIESMVPIEADPEAKAKFEDALEKSGISDAQRSELLAELEKQGRRFGMELSADKAFLMHSGSEIPGVPIEAALVEIVAGKAAEPTTAGQVRVYLERQKEHFENTAAQIEATTKELKRIDSGEITGGLMPAADPQGDWRSLGETREGEKHFLVEHDDLYYKVLRVNPANKTVQVQEFKEGNPERDLTVPYEYDASQGQLTTTTAGGGPGDAFVVMEIQGVPDRLFVRPLYDTVFAFTVYRRAGKNPTLVRPPVVRSTPPPPTEK
jgi:hypothetical protein